MTSRRGLLLGAGGLIVAGAAGGLWLFRGDPSDVPLDPSGRRARPDRLRERNVDGDGPDELPPYLTPVGSFYVYTNGDVPDPLGPGWRLTVGDRSLDFEALSALPGTDQIRTLQCVGNGKPGDTTFGWRFGGISNASWRIVPLRTVVGDLPEQQPEARYVVLEAADGWVRGFPLEQLERDDFGLAVAMNGAPLPHLHGAPTRLIAPGQYGEMNVKWVIRIRLTREPPEEDGAPMPTALPIKPMAFATTPRWGSWSEEAPRLAGVAYAGLPTVERVVLRSPSLPEPIEAELLDPARPGAWRRWQLPPLPLEPGWHQIWIACEDSEGRVSEPPVDAADEGWGTTGRGVVHELLLGQT